MNMIMYFFFTHYWTDRKDVSEETWYKIVETIVRMQGMFGEFKLDEVENSLTTFPLLTLRRVERPSPTP